VLAFALVMAPVMRLLSLRNTMPAADLTITMTGHMWFWNFKYSNHANFSFDAPMLSNSAGETISNLAASATFDHIMVPVARTVRIVAVATNVIYSWAIPSLGAKIEAVPGWNSQTWFKPAKEGRYFGKCSELCGLPHKFKPIEIEVVSQARFDRWVAESKGKLTPAGAPHPRGEEARSEAWNAR
jgi:cytochrome c oxidase subunit 2